MAIAVAPSMAPPMPCKERRIISIIIELVQKAIAEAAVKIAVPIKKTFLIPIISAIRPNGKEKMADNKTKEVITQLNWMASALNS